MGTITFGTTNNNDLGFGGNSSGFTQIVTQPFVADQNIASIDVYLSFFVTTGVTDNLDITIQAESAGNPTGTPLGTTLSIPSSFFPVNTQFQPAVYLGTITGLNLTNGVTYYVCANRSGAFDNSHYYNVGQQSVASTPYTHIYQPPTGWITLTPRQEIGSVVTYAPVDGPVNVKTVNGLTMH